MRNVDLKKNLRVTGCGSGKKPGIWGVTELSLLSVQVLAILDVMCSGKEIQGGNVYRDWRDRGWGCRSCVRKVVASRLYANFQRF